MSLRAIWMSPPESLSWGQYKANQTGVGILIRRGTVPCPCKAKELAQRSGGPAYIVGANQHTADLIA